jgi:hypothetical protein
MDCNFVVNSVTCLQAKNKFTSTKCHVPLLTSLNSFKLELFYLTKKGLQAAQENENYLQFI